MGVGTGVGVNVGVGVAAGDGVGVGVGVSTGDGDGVGVTVGVGVGVGVVAGDGVGVGVGAVTRWVVVPLLALKLLSPLYAAVSVFWPTVELTRLQPLAGRTMTHTAPVPSFTATVPKGFPFPVAGLTEAVTV